MFYEHGFGRRLAGGSLILASLTSVQVGYAAILGVLPLEAALIMLVSGAVALALWLICRGGRKAGPFDRAMWKLVLRLALGLTVISVSYLYAQERLTPGTAASALVAGVLAVGCRGVWKHRGTALGLLHLAWRLAAFGGVLITEPWRGGADLLGVLLAAVSALSAWNTPTTLGKMAERGEADRGATAANLLAVPALAVLVAFLHQGTSASPGMLFLCGIAGVLVNCVPFLLQNAAIRKVAPRDLAVVLALSPAVAALVARAGIGLGLIDASQRTTGQGWIAIAVIIAASVGASMTPSLPDGDAAE